MANYQRESEAMRCLVQLSFLAPGATLSGEDLAQRESLSARTVAYYMERLERAGLVAGHPASGGARCYRLARAADRIALADVRFALAREGEVSRQAMTPLGPTVAGIAAAEDAAFADPRAALAA